MAIDPRISLGVQPIQLDNPLAQYGQVQNILAAQQQMRGAETQQQVSQLQLQNLQRSAEYADKMQKAIVDNGGPLDLEQAASMMASHPDPQVQMHGVTLLQSLKDKKMFEDYIGKMYPSSEQAPLAAPAGPSVVMKPPVAGPNQLGSGAYNLGASMPNQLASVIAAPPNKLAVPAPVESTPVSPGASQVDSLKREIASLSLLNDPRAAKLLAVKEAELKNLQSFHVVPNVGLVNAANNVVVKAPPTPTNLSRLMEERAALPPGDPRIATYDNMIKKETEAAPTQIASLIKERDALAPNDPNRAVYTAQINETQNRLDIARANLGVSQGHLALAKKRFDEEFAASKLTPATIDLMAQIYTQTGNLPPVGAGKKGADAKAAILNRAQEISTGNGTTSAQAAANVIGAKQDVAAQTAALKDFSAGQSSKRVTANNTALNHLATLDKLAGDLANSDVRIVNAAGNAFARATGSAAPTNFDAAKQLVASEVIKAVTQNGGGVTERQEAANNIKLANSPEQLRGVIQTYKELLGGQLSSLGQQYETGTGRKDFEKKLSPATRDLLKQSTPAAAPVSGFKYLGKE